MPFKIAEVYKDDTENESPDPLSAETRSVPTELFRTNCSLSQALQHNGYTILSAVVPA